MPRVHLPDGRIVHFPYDMAQEQIEAEVAKLAGPQEPEFDQRESLASHMQRGPEVLSEGPDEGPSTMDNLIESMRGVAHPQSLGDLAPLLHMSGAGLAVAGAKSLAGKLPGGRLLKAGWAGAKASMPQFGQRGVRGALRSWKSSAPNAGTMVPEAGTPTPAMAGPAVKPKLSAPEVAAKLREHYGSDRAGRMLYGPVQRGAAGSDAAVASSAARKDAIKRLAPGESHLPAQAQTAMQRQMAGFTDPAEAFKYAAKAPNDQARAYFGEQLRAALLEQMKRRGQ